jgi:hypothetical protein
MMYQDPDAATLAGLEAEALRDERALVAEGQRLVLHRGRDLVTMSATVAGSTGAREAQRFIDIVLWHARSPEGWPVGSMVETFRTPASLSPGDRALHAELLRSLLRLARSADDLHALRARLHQRRPRAGAFRTDLRRLRAALTVAVTGDVRRSSPMNETLHNDDPIRCASAAFACARRVRIHADEATAAEPCGETSRSLGAILEALGKPEGFSEAFLDDLRAVIAGFEARVSAGTTVGFEVHDAWTEGGAETTTVRSIEEMSPEARQLAVVLADLRRLARLIEAKRAIAIRPSRSSQFRPRTGSRPANGT